MTPSAEIARTNSRVVLLSDRSAQAESLAETLREAGFAVVTTAMAAVVERARRVRPLAVVLDLEEAAGATQLEALRLDQEALIVVLAPPERAHEHESGPELCVFTRPVPPAEVARWLRRAAGLTGAGDPLADESSVGDERLIVSDFPALAGLPEVEALLPDAEGEAGACLVSRLSPEIEALLEASAQRVRDARAGLEEAAANDHAVAVPADVLASLDELLLPSPDARAAPSEREASRSHGTGVGTNPGTTPGAPVSARGGPSEMPEPTWHGLPPVGSPSAPLENDAPRSRRPVSSVPLPASTTNAPRTEAAPPHSSEARGDPTTPRADLRAPPTPDRPRTLPPATPARSSELPSGWADRTAQMYLPSLLEGAASQPYSPAARGDPDSQKRAETPQPRATTPRDDPAVTRPPSEEPPSSQAALSEAPLTRYDPRAVADAARRSRKPDAPPVSREEPAPLESGREQLGDPIAVVAQAIAGRVTGALRLVSEDGERVRRVVLRDGDIVTAASDVDDETLLFFLVERGDLSPEIAGARAQKLPKAGRHAAAALIANGFLSQDDLWPVLRAHAEWVTRRALRELPTRCLVERDAPDRLRQEPNVFGGAAGVEVFVDAVRRVLPPEEAVVRLGGKEALIGEGRFAPLLAESALDPEDLEAVRQAPGRTAGQVLGASNPELASVVYALVALGILSAHGGAPSPPSSRRDRAVDPLDEDAVRARVRARLSLVEEGDYFALLGVPPSATGYDIKSAYLELRRSFEPARVVTPATADLGADLRLILEVLEEAYQVLRDPHRRSRYRRALEATQK